MTSCTPCAPVLVCGPAHDPQLATAGEGTGSAPASNAQPLNFFCDLPAGARVLDVGCGRGTHLKALTRRGCRVVGVEPDASAVVALRAAGYEVLRGSAEQLPCDDASFDAIVCSVVVPYTDERRTIAEWARVLRLGGEVRASYHGWGYALRQLLAGPGLRVRAYGARTLANSGLYHLTGRRLPGFLGDTLVQATSRLLRTYRKAPLKLVGEFVRPGLLGARDVFYHRLIKTNSL